MYQIVWVDLECTGVNTEKDLILEVAMVFTDGNLNETASKNIVIHHDELPPMDPAVVEMHSKSNLLDEVQKSKTTLYGAQEMLMEFIEANLEKSAEKVPMGGNNIGFDRKFMDKYMTKVNRAFHFRSIDVSSFNEVAKRWYPEILKKLPSKNFAHRAMGDIRESINELKFYRREMFKNIPEKGKTLSLF